MTVPTPVAIYNFEKFGAGQLTDTLGFANLTVSGTGVSISSDGYLGNCLALDSTGSFSISGAGLALSTADIVVTAWINIPAATGNMCLLSVYPGGGGSPTSSLRFVPVTASTFRLYAGGSSSSTVLQCGVWHFVGWRGKNSSISSTSVSANGAPWESLLSGGSPTNDMFIGANHDITIFTQGPLFERFNGRIDQLQVYQSDVSSAQFAEAFAAGSAAAQVIPASVTDGETVQAVALNTLLDPTLVALQAANSEAPTVYYHRFAFDHLDSTGSVAQEFIVPDDYYLEDVSVSAGNHSGTLTVTIDNSAMIEVITVSGACSGSGYTKLTRYYSDTSNPFQVFLKGSILTVIASTTASANSSTVSVMLGFVVARRRA